MTASPFSARRFLIIFSIGWIVLMADHALVLNWFGLTWKAGFLDSLISNVIFIAELPGDDEYTPVLCSKGQQYVNILAMCIVLTVIWLFLVQWLLGLTLGNQEHYTEFLHNSIIIRFSIAFLVLGIVTTITIIWFNWQEEQKTEHRDAEAEKLAREAELFKLRQQLQPHFLFNSLNSINALIGIKTRRSKKNGTATF